MFSSMTPESKQQVSFFFLSTYFSQNNGHRIILNKFQNLRWRKIPLPYVVPFMGNGRLRKSTNWEEEERMLYSDFSAMQKYL